LEGNQIGFRKEIGAVVVNKAESVTEDGSTSNNEMTKDFKVTPSPQCVARIFMTNPSAIKQLAEGEKPVVTKEVADNTAVEEAGKLSDVSSGL
jgi:hypothetical protein